MSFGGMFGGPDLAAAPPPKDEEPDTRQAAIDAAERERKRVGLNDLRAIGSSPPPSSGVSGSLGVPRG